MDNHYRSRNNNDGDHRRRENQHKKHIDTDNHVFFNLIGIKYANIMDYTCRACSLGRLPQNLTDSIYRTEQKYRIKPVAFGKRSDGKQSDGKQSDGKRSDGKRSKRRSDGKQLKSKQLKSKQLKSKNTRKRNQKQIKN